MTGSCFAENSYWCHGWSSLSTTLKMHLVNLFTRVERPRANMAHEKKNYGCLSGGKDTERMFITRADREARLSCAKVWTLCGRERKKFKKMLPEGLILTTGELGCKPIKRNIKSGLRVKAFLNCLDKLLKGKGLLNKAAYLSLELIYYLMVKAVSTANDHVYSRIDPLKPFVGIAS